MSSITRKFALQEPTYGALMRAMAEARDVGVPERARPLLAIIEPGSPLAGLYALAGDHESYLALTWED